jgi:hypothetical protein
MAANYIDPYGSPEFFCNDMILEQIAPGLIRVRMLCHENGESVLRCTLLLPEAVLGRNIQRTREFIDTTPPLRMMAN